MRKIIGFFIIMLLIGTTITSLLIICTLNNKITNIKSDKNSQ